MDSIKGAAVVVAAVSYGEHLRVCRICGKMGLTWSEGAPGPLFKYGARHYAHAWCLAANFGTKGGADRLSNKSKDQRRWYEVTILDAPKRAYEAVKLSDASIAKRAKAVRP